MLINLLGFEFGPETELVKVLLLFSSVTLFLKTYLVGNQRSAIIYNLISKTPE
jgi:hypothetical protein